MAIENDFQVFAGGGGANVLSQAEYLAMPALTTGYQSGVAQSAQLNKTWRQASIIAAMIAQFIVDNSGQTAIDDGTIATLEANFEKALGVLFRVKLAAPLDLYVSTTGSDSNDGMTAATPFATIQHAVNFIYNTYDTNGHNVTVNLANGTYNQSVQIAGPLLGYSSQGGIIQIVGNLLNPTAVVLSVTNANCVTVGTGAYVQLTGFTVQATGVGNASTGCGIVADTGGNIFFTGLNFGQCGGQQMWATESSTISSDQPYSISHGANSHYFAEANSIINVINTTVTIASGSTFTQSFAVATELGLLQCYGNTYSGTAVGPRYLSTLNGIITTNTSGSATYLPGSTAGAVSLGGQYW